MRVCYKCKLTKRLSSFTKDKTKKYGHGYLCKDCRSNFRYEKKYGLSLENYLELLARQNGNCKICSKSHLDCQYKKLDIDHCHKTQKIRGLLCGDCNRAIGLLKDNLVLVTNLAEYLKKEDSNV